MSHLADLPALPRRLAAPEPGWTESTDVLMVGSGVAGLTAALHLREQGLLRSEKAYVHSVGFCQRSGTRVEPLVSLQWFCRMDELAAPATAAVPKTTFSPFVRAARRTRSWLSESTRSIAAKPSAV